MSSNDEKYIISVNDQNLTEARAFFEGKHEKRSDGKRFTMMQKNSPSKVTVSVESRKKCAEMLARIV